MRKGNYEPVKIDVSLEMVTKNFRTAVWVTGGIVDHLGNNLYDVNVKVEDVLFNIEVMEPWTDTKRDC